MPKPQDDYTMGDLAADISSLDTRLTADIHGLDTRLAGVEVKVGSLDGQMGEQRQETRELRQDTKAGFERMQRTMLGAAVAIIVALIGSPHL